MIRRLVGYHEYKNALINFDQLYELSSAQDLTVFDELLADRHEFDLYVTLPPLFDPAQQNGAPLEDSTTLEKRHPKSGLAWVTALARTELGAMLAGFTAVANPYQMVAPNNHDRAQTLQLLLEGVVNHSAALQNDPAFTLMRHKKEMPIEIKKTLAVARRVRMARSMLFPLLAQGAGSYSVAQADELGRGRTDLNQRQSLLNDRIRGYLAAERNSGSSTQSMTERVTGSFVDACGMQLRAEQRELQSGLATVTNLDGSDRR